jgi:hypothetical protein
MKTENHKENELNEFINYCKTTNNIQHVSTYYNCVKLYFENVITTDIFDKLVELKFKFYVVKSGYSTNSIYLYIYKEKTYDFN